MSRRSLRLALLAPVLLQASARGALSQCSITEVTKSAGAHVDGDRFLGLQRRHRVHQIHVGAAASSSGIQSGSFAYSMPCRNDTTGIQSISKYAE